MNIRPIDLPDLPQFFALLRAKATFDGSPERLCATVALLRDAFFTERPIAHALVADLDGRLVGIANYHPIFSSFIAKRGLWLDDLYVDEAFRGRGVGRELMQRLCRIAETGHCGRVDWHVSAFNPRGIGFYRGLGATVSENARLVRLGETGIRTLAEAVC